MWKAAAFGHYSNSIPISNVIRPINQRKKNIIFFFSPPHFACVECFYISKWWFKKWWLCLNEPHNHRDFVQRCLGKWYIIYGQYWLGIQLVMTFIDWLIGSEDLLWRHSFPQLTVKVVKKKKPWNCRWHNCFHKCHSIEKLKPNTPFSLRRLSKATEIGDCKGFWFSVTSWIWLILPLF